MKRPNILLTGKRKTTAKGPVNRRKNNGRLYSFRSSAVALSKRKETNGEFERA